MAKTTEEFGWVIERGDSETCAPTYWAGPDRWSQDHMDAIRFSRKCDGERVACRIGQGYHRVCEHGWIDGGINSQIAGIEASATDLTDTTDTDYDPGRDM